MDPDTGRNLQKLSGNPNKEASTFWNTLLPSLEQIIINKTKKLDELLALAGVSNVGNESSKSKEMKGRGEEGEGEGSGNIKMREAFAISGFLAFYFPAAVLKIEFIDSTKLF